MNYRVYKNFDNKLSFEELQLKLNKLLCLTKTIGIFRNELRFLINMPLKKEYVTANEANSVDTELNYAVTVHLEFQCQFLKKRSNITRLNEDLKKILTRNIH